MRVCEAEGCRSGGTFDRVVDESEMDNTHESRNSGTSRGKSVCSKCCIEVGTEGKVWCTVCYEDDADDGRQEEYSGDDDSGEREEDETGRVKEWLNSFGEG